MREPHGKHAKVMRDTHQTGPYHRFMINGQGSSTRTLTIVLPESDWRALRDAEPDAIGWLQARIRERLASPGTQLSRTHTPPSAATADSWWGDDEY